LYSSFQKNKAINYEPWAKEIGLGESLKDLRKQMDPKIGIKKYIFIFYQKAPEGINR